MTTAPHSTSTHPLDVDLVSHPLSDEVAAHVDTCRLCRDRLSAAADSVETPEVRPGAASRDLPRVAVASELVAVTQGYEFDATPQAGQLWRAEFQSEVALVFLHRVDEDEQMAAMIPVGEDWQYADAATVIVDDNPLGQALGLWVAAERMVSLVVLDRPLGTLSAQVKQDVTAVRRWLRSGAPHGVDDVGSQIVSDADERIRYRHALTEPLDRLATALEPTPDASAESLKDLVRERGLQAGDVADTLRWERHDALELLRGQRTLTSPEILRLAPLLETDAATVAALAPQPDVELLKAAHSPRQRRKARDWANRRDVSEADARHRAVAAAMKMARRSRPGDGAPDWYRLLDDFFLEYDEK